jgi:phosphoribosylanthranilate isomerase
LKVKICGIKYLQDAINCANLGADALGFILYPKSKRYIKPEDIKKIICQLPPFITKVGVFVNENIKLVNEIVKETGINSVQLHGNETQEYISKIKCSVIKSFRIHDDFDFGILNKYDNCHFLLDAYDNEEFGGTGKKFDWLSIPNNMKNKIILAGGISVDDLEFIYKNISPYAIDISSSVEIEPGIKNEIKLEILFNKIRELRDS